MKYQEPLEEDLHYALMVMAEVDGSKGRLAGRTQALKDANKHREHLEGMLETLETQLPIADAIKMGWSGIAKAMGDCETCTEEEFERRCDENLQASRKSHPFIKRAIRIRTMLARPPENMSNER